MANLFSKSILKKEVLKYQGLNIDREKQIVNDLFLDYKKGITKDETRYEQRFNELFFHQLLGYEPTFHLHPKASTPVGSKIADVGLGFFPSGGYSYEGVKVVVELKGSDNLLDKKQISYGGQTPVDQGFGYKTSFQNCPRLIVSNFISIRLYKDNKQDFEIWTLEDLCNPHDDYYELKKLLAILSRKYLICESGTSYTENLLSTVRVAQEKITKKFYSEYKTLRLQLINDMRSRNADVSVEVLIEKAQKLIDRIIFILFCEDKGLLPEGKLKANLIKARDVGFTPRELLQRFFRFIDKGSPDGSITAYNGGLFIDDAELNGLHIGDTICYKFVELGGYDFDDELSVNILGHIFEQSISDLEQLKIQMLGNEITTDNLVESKVSKRKKDGIFYTPEYIVDYIVQNSLMTYLEERESECLAKVGKKGGYKTELECYQAYQQILQNVKVLDPACGSGAFLVKVFDKLYEENIRIGKILENAGALELDSTETYKTILQNNIYGVDLNAESVEITKLSLWLKSAQKNKKLNNLDSNIKCGNSLIDDVAVAGDKAFDWNVQFADIMNAGGFDVIVGNPPYVDSESMTKHYPKERDFISKTYETAKGNRDLFIPFIEKAFKLTKQKSKTSMIVPNKWLSMNYGSSLRVFIKGYLTILSDFSKIEVFQGVGIFPIILNFGKEIEKTIRVEAYGDNMVLLNSNRLDKLLFKQLDNFGIYFSQSLNILSKIMSIKNSSIIGSVSDVFGAFTTGEAYELTKFINDDKNLSGKKLINTGTIDRYANFRGINQTTYLKEKYLYPTIHESDLSTKFQSRFKKINKPKIIISGIRHFESFYDKKNEYLAGKSTSVLTNINKDYLFETIVSILNSKLISFFLKEAYASSGMDGGINFSPDLIKSIPIPKIQLSNQQFFVERADIMLSLNKELHELQSKFIARIKTNLTEKITKSLERFYEGSFTDFLKELAKQKIRLSLIQQDERESYFNDYKSKILGLKSEIAKTDSEIDTMVFNIYELTEAERKVILES